MKPFALISFSRRSPNQKENFFSIKWCNQQEAQHNEEDFVSLLPRRVLLSGVSAEGKRGGKSRLYEIQVAQAKSIQYVSGFCFSFMMVLFYFTVKNICYSKIGGRVYLYRDRKSIVCLPCIPHDTCSIPVT